MSTATQNLSYVLSLVDRASAPLMGFRRRLAAMPKETRDNLQQAGQSLKNIGATISTAVTAIGGASLIQRADIEDAMGEVASLGVKDLEALRRAGRQFAAEWSGASVPEFIRASYDVKSGISTLTDQGVADFTTLAALTAKGSKATIGQITALFAQTYSIYRKQFGSDQEFGQALSGGLSKAVNLYKTNGKEMADALANLASTATSLNVPLNEQLVVLGTLQNSLKSGAEGGTATKAIWANLGRASLKLGQDFVDAAGNAKPLPEILDKIRRAEGRAKDKRQFWEAMKEAFGGDEAVKGLQILLDKTGQMKEDLGEVAQAQQRGTDTAREMAQAMNQGIGGEGRKAWQSILLLADSIGSALSPVVTPLVEKFHALTLRLADFVERHPALTRAIMLGALALGGLTFALGAAAVAVMGFNAAMALNPVTWIIAAIVVAVGGLIAAGLAIYAYWDEIKAWFVGIWTQWGETIKTVVSAIGAGLVMLSGPIGALIGLGLLLVSNWEAVGQFFSDLLTGITDAFNSAVSWITDQIKSLVDILPEFVKKKLGLKVEVEPQLARPSAQAAPLSYASPTANSVAAGAAGAAQRPAQAEVTVRMDFANLPKGAALTTLDQHGNADLNVLAGLNYAPGQ